jgi:uncharacterized protein DUF1761
MQLPQVNYLAVLVAGIVIFLLGGLWYSPLLFAKRWTALQGRTEEQMRAQAAAANMPLMYLSAFICGLIIAWAMAVLGNCFMPPSAISVGDWVMRGIKLGAFAWFGFVLPTSYATALFSMKPKQLWLIDAGYNLVAFVLAGIILMAWIGIADPMATR